MVGIPVIPLKYLFQNQISQNQSTKNLKQQSIIQIYPKSVHTIVKKISQIGSWIINFSLQTWVKCSLKGSMVWKQRSNFKNSKLASSNFKALLFKQIICLRRREKLSLNLQEKHKVYMKLPQSLQFIRIQCGS